MKKGKARYNRILLWSVGIAAVVLSLILIYLKSGEKKAAYKVLCSEGPAFVMTDKLLEETGCTVTAIKGNGQSGICLADGSAAETRLLYDASALVLSGAEDEGFVKEIVSLAPGLPVIVMADCHKESENPFIWMNADFEMDCIDFVGSELCNLFPDLKEKITDNGGEFSDALFEGAYNKRLELTDAIEESERLIRIIVLSDACEAFSDSFGFYNIASFALNREEFPTESEREEAVIKAKRCEEVLIFAEERDASYAESIAKEVSATVIRIDPLTSSDSTEAYISGLSKNLEALNEYINREG